MESEIADLTRRLQLLERGRRRSRSASKRRGSRSRNRAVQFRGKSPAPSTSRAARGKRRQAPLMPNISQGCMKVAKSELLATVAVEKKNDPVVFEAEIDPGSSSLTGLNWLRRIAGLFDQVRWLSLEVHWEPAVGYNANGFVQMGFDWDSAVVTSSSLDSRIYAMSPNKGGPIREPMRMAIPAAKFQHQRWMRMHLDGAEAVLGKLVCRITSDLDAKMELGRFHLNYKVEMQGTRYVP